MEKRFEVNVPEAVLPRRSPDELQSASRREVLMNAQDYQLLSDCLKTHDPDSIYPKKMMLLKTVNLLGRRFEASPSKNSFVLVRLSSTEQLQVVAASIRSIFSHVRRMVTGAIVTENFAKILLFEPLSTIDSLQDLYRQFPFAGGQLYYNRLSPRSRVIPFDDIVVHFGQTPTTIEGIAGECLHVAPLPRT
jgi:hypothetical protein